MIITTSDSIPGKRIVKVLGLTKGNTVRARNIGRDVVAELRNLVGGEIVEYTKLMAESREQAIDRMDADANAMGANAIVGFRFTTAQIMEHAAELLAYGTAVVVEDDK
jgi:uncharacterized protein YbjQ (UPF0145 family)